MAPLPPFCSTRASHGGPRKHKINSTQPCHWCGLDPATFHDSEDEVELNSNTTTPRLSQSSQVIDITTATSDSELEATPTQTRRGILSPHTSSTADVFVSSPSSSINSLVSSRRTTANSLQPLRDGVQRLAMNAMTQSGKRMRRVGKEHAGNAPPNIHSNHRSSITTPKQKGVKPVVVSHLQLFHITCVGIVERVCYKDAFEKECGITHIIARTLACKSSLQLINIHTNKIKFSLSLSVVLMSS